MPWQYCSCDKKPVQKIQKAKILNENFISQWQTEKMAKCFFHGERTSKMANLFKISHEMANLATLASSILNAL